METRMSKWKVQDKRIENANVLIEGTLGTVSEGGYADLLLAEGNPLEDLGAVTNVDNLKIIMKDGVIYKNTL
jgi:imidazolonepropionase-like amidohydrolase